MEMKLDDFISIVSDYYGTLKEDNEKVTFTNYNMLGKRKVKCEISFYKEKGILCGEEETIEIIGGFGFPHADTDILIRELERYQFVKKEYTQYTLF